MNNPIISKNVGWGTVKNPSQKIELDNYDELSKLVSLKDMRKTSKNEYETDKNFKEDFSNICKKSILPIPGYVDAEDDRSSESYAPHSDWQGSSGEAWIGK